MIESLRIFSHLVLLVVQARLLQHVWTQPKLLENRLVGWTRTGLLGLTLALLFAYHSLLRHNPHIIRPLKLNLGCMFGQNFFKAILLAFNKPGPARIAKLRQSSHPPEPVTFSQTLSLVSSATSNPSKQSKPVPGGSSNHTIWADLAFLLSTLHRVLVLNTFSVLGLYCWKGVHDEAIVGRYPILKQYVPQITAVVWGLFIWTGIDLTGCLGRIMAFIFKSIHRLLRSHTQFCSAESEFIKADLEQRRPFLFPKSPLEASSICAFWSTHWHTHLRDLFVEAGTIPLSSFVIWTFGARKAPPKLLRLSGIIGAFAVSAILHEFAVWSAGPFDRRLRTSTFFLSQGLGMCLESGFKSLSGHRVVGPLGKIWTLVWLVFFATPMLQAWLENMAVDKHRMFESAERLGIWRMLFTPLILPRLIFS